MRPAIIAVALLAGAACTPPPASPPAAAPPTPPALPDGGVDYTDPTTTTTTTTEAPRPTTTRPSRSSAPAPPKPAENPPVVAGACGGWRDLIAEYFPPERVARACRIMLCESTGQEWAVGPQDPRDPPGFRPRGLFQIKGYVDRPARENVAHAAGMSSGGTNWSAWSCQ